MVIGFIASFIVVNSAQTAPITLDTLSGKTFDEVAGILGKPLSTNAQRGMGESRVFRSPFKLSKQLALYRKEGEIIPGQIQVIFPEGFKDWKAALGSVGIDSKGAKLKGMEVTGITSKWTPHWDAKERVLLLNVPRAVITSNTKRIAGQPQLNLVSLAALPEADWRRSLGNPTERDEPYDVELEHETTKATKKASEWRTVFASNGYPVEVHFRGQSSGPNVATVVSIPAKKGQSIEQLLSAIQFPSSSFSTFVKAEPSRLPSTMVELHEAKAKDGKWIATFSVYQDQAEPAILTLYNVAELPWRQK